MDPVSQSLLGAVSAQVGFRQKIGRDATWVAALAAASPDFDMLFFRPLQAMVSHSPYWMRVFAHRGISHSLLAIPIYILPLAVLWWGFRRIRPRPDDAPAPAPFWMLYLCVLVAGLTHPLLDWCTSYGTQLWAPLTTQRYALDCVAIVDPFFTLLMAFVLMLCWWVRRKNPGGEPRRSIRVGCAGALLTVSYLAAGAAAGNLAVQRAIEGMDPNTPVIQARAYPVIGSILLWRVVVETPEGIHTVRVHHLNGDDPASLPRNIRPRHDGVLVDRVRELPAVQDFLWFSDGRVREEVLTEEIPGLGEITTVRFHDLRYGLSPEDPTSLWTFEVLLDDKGRVLTIRQTRPGYPDKAGPSRSEMLRQIWSQLWEF